jgi:subtilisin family serine protease
MRALGGALALTIAAACAGCASVGMADAGPPSVAVTGDDFIVVAVADTPEPRPAAGAATRGGYGRAAGYAGSDRALALAASLAEAHGLSEVQAWTIAPLRWRCMLYRLPAGSTREAMLAVLAADPRVQLVQPLNQFETLATPGTPSPYNDPYHALQNGFARIDAEGAQGLTRGEGVTVAIIDTGLDEQHPELQGRVAGVRDFVGGTGTARAAERHGTQVAGIIAAAANNGIGIVGVAPAVRVLSLRACWAVPADGVQPGAGAAARCNSFTLARALAAAIAAGADIINLSLGGPHDALLERLAQWAMARGSVVVGALPANGRREGFPSALPGVLAVAASEDRSPTPGTLAAPGQRILTLTPGGHYDFVSGSSMAAAHVSGAVALMRSVDGGLDGAALLRLLGESHPIDVCRALRGLPARAGAQPAVRCAGPP